MRALKLMVPVGVAMLVLAGCSTDDNNNGAPAPETTSSTSASPTTSESEDTEAAVESNTIVDVDEADYTPSDAPNARQFVLADGSTQCVFNQLGATNYLSCEANIVNAPMVEGADGQEAPANSVAFTGESVTYQALTFPGGSEQPKVLETNQRLSAFGFSCLAGGPATVTCDGPEGSVTIDNGNVTGASAPEPVNATDPEADTEVGDEPGALDDLRGLLGAN